jgi:mono/diheme cytochrome c family protein
MKIPSALAIVGSLVVAGAAVVGIRFIPGVAWKPLPGAATNVPGSAAPTGPALPEVVTFNTHIQPILSENCYACHGPDSGSRKADLRLDRAEFAFKPTKSGQAVILKGEGASSEIIKRMRHKDPKEIMPPPATHKVVSERDIALLEKWINQDAGYEEHWSLIPPKLPPVPAVPNSNWPVNPIDRFILDRLQKENLSPAPEADKAALLRRVTLDLTGLPPAPETVDAFLADSRPDAYEKAVDRLLDSPAYGEQQARYWLDAARYADTHGIHFDNYRSIWPYRDWVIKAFNTNQPFDQFTLEQLAGDLLPGATIDQQIATGFHRCLATTGEGGAIADEYLATYARDRVETTSRVWLGLTTGCASCHDHKFDPISQKDFYQLSAFFRNNPMSALDGNSAEHPPNLLIPKAEDVPRMEELARLLPLKEQALKDAEKQEAEQIKAALATPAAAAASLPEAPVDMLLALAAAEGSGGTADFTLNGQRAKTTFGGNYQWIMHGPVPALAPGENFSAELGDFANYPNTQAFSHGAWVRGENLTGALLSRIDATHSLAGWDLWFENNTFGTHLIHQWPDNAIKVLSTTKLPPNEWCHVLVTYDGSSKAAGVQLYLNGKSVPVKVHSDSLTGTLANAVQVQVARRTPGQVLAKASFHDLRLYPRALSADEAPLIALAALRPHLAALAPDKLEPSLQAILAAGITRGKSAADPLRREVAALQAERDAIRKRGVITLVMKENNEEPSAHILSRGEYTQKKDKVGADIPAVFGVRIAKSDPKNRLGLARWLVHPDHPLTARVTVNRFWQQLFGTGLVASADDFGIKGDRPVHPELLDWLALEFRSHGWDVKKLMKLMVTSASYRQSGAATPAKLEKDPANRLLARGPRQRLDGEMIRDQALFVSGLLVHKIGGPSVKPYQPDGVWEAVAMKESNTRKYVRDSGEALYRRSLYTFWKRSAPHPSLETFGTPSRENSTVRRERTNTPLQALVTLNDIQLVEAARVLAERVLKQKSTDPERFDFLYRVVLARPPKPTELSILTSALTDFRTTFGKSPDDAKKLVAYGERVADPALAAPELAAWTLIASNTLNLDESLNH